MADYPYAASSQFRCQLPQLRCPKCQTSLSIADTAAGAVIACSGCQAKIKVPAPKAATFAPVGPPPLPNAVKSAAPRSAAPPPTPLKKKQSRAENYDEPDDDEDDVDRRPSRRKKKRKGKRNDSAFGMWSDLPREMQILAGLTVVSVVFAVLGLFVTDLVAIPMLIAMGMMIVGHVFVLIAAANESAIQVCLVLCVPFYALFYVISRYDDVRYPVKLYFTGFGLLLVSYIVAAIGA